MEQEAKCSICQEYLRDLVTVDCGHNYCQGCITTHCKTCEELELDLTCPVCRTPIQRGNFRPNWQLANLVEKLQQLNIERESLCVIHKEKLHLFCREDKELICWKCKSSTKHRSHTVLLKEEATQEYKDQICGCLETLREKKEKILAHKIDMERESQDLLKQMKAEREKTVVQFQQLRRFLEEQEKLLLAQMDEVEKEIESRRKEHMAKISEKLSSMEGTMQEMEEKHQRPDIKGTLKKSEENTFENSVVFSAALKWKIWDICDMNPILEGSIKQFKDALKSGVQLKKANVSLDPDTANPRLILSGDHQSVTLGEKCQNLPDNPERFDTMVFVLGCEGFTAGRHFWEVVVGSEGEWSVGVARKSVRRKGVITSSPEEGIWEMGKWDGKYRASDPSARLCLREEPKRIRVSLNYDGGRVAFYDADTAGLIYAYPAALFSGETLLPFFWVFEKAHLTLSPSGGQRVATVIHKPTAALTRFGPPPKPELRQSQFHAVCLRRRHFKQKTFS
ncbi:tripartite motif-containing protein 10-like [Elgaria multicarinata webbii]|uniref:tripartite motif-containing protein 10-like n=1 Tax=Elgaria multicarinata webbii TaxID=159646 RepID=UPI002FCCF4A1